jgi:tRNA(fMet)-specific endonuclease VapC
VILDTNGLSALADGDAALEPLLRQCSQVALPVIVLGEYLYGIRKSRNHLQYRRWLAEFLPKCRVLDVDSSTAEAYAGVREELKSKGRPVPANDLWIAALACQHGLPVVSRDQHFDFVSGVKRLEW